MKKAISIFTILSTLLTLGLLLYGAFIGQSIMQDFQNPNFGSTYYKINTQSSSGSSVPVYTGGSQTVTEEETPIPEDFDITPYCAMTVNDALDEPEIISIINEAGQSVSTVKLGISVMCSGFDSSSKTLSQLISECPAIGSEMSDAGLSCS